METTVREVVAAIDRRDWDGLKALLHPYLHWTTTSGEAVRGRTKVLARLKQTPPSGPPLRVELRDGQVYRWVESG